MSKAYLSTKTQGGRVPFRVPLNPDQLVEICTRRNQHADRRTLAEWVEDGLRLALAADGVATARSELSHGFDREIELFCVLASSAPAEFVGTWRLLYEYVRERDEYWVFPTTGTWPEDAREVACVEPYLDRDALAADWERLLTAAVSFRRGVDSAAGLRNACRA